MIAWPDVRPVNAWCLPQTIFVPHIDRVLATLGLPVEGIRISCVPFYRAHPLFSSPSSALSTPFRYSRQQKEEEEADDVGIQNSWPRSAKPDNNIDYDPASRCPYPTDGISFLARRERVKLITRSFSEEFRIQK
jgi:hypothetical protein